MTLPFAGCHRDAGAGVDRDRTGAADRGEQRRRARRRPAPRSRAACSSVNGSTAAVELVDAHAAAPSTVAVGAVAQQLADEERENRVVGARTRRQVVGGEPRGLGTARVDDPDLGVRRAARGWPTPDRGSRPSARATRPGCRRRTSRTSPVVVGARAEARPTPPTRSDTSTLAVPSMVSGLNLAGVPMRAEQRLRHPVAGGVHAVAAAEEHADGRRTSCVR